eukprot:1521566-Pyramimonas_sp.AAC.1
MEAVMKPPGNMPSTHCAVHLHAGGAPPSKARGTVKAMPCRAPTDAPELADCPAPFAGWLQTAVPALVMGPKCSIAYRRTQKLLPLEKDP